MWEQVLLWVKGVWELNTGHVKAGRCRRPAPVLNSISWHQWDGNMDTVWVPNYYPCHMQPCCPDLHIWQRIADLSWLYHCHSYIKMKKRYAHCPRNHLNLKTFREKLHIDRWNLPQAIVGRQCGNLSSLFLQHRLECL